MSVLDGIRFWIGKAVAEVAIFAVVLVLIVIVAVVAAWREERRTRRASPPGDRSEGGET